MTTTGAVQDSASNRAVVASNAAARINAEGIRHLLALDFQGDPLKSLELLVSIQLFDFAHALSAYGMEASLDGIGLNVTIIPSAPMLSAVAA